MLGEAHTVVGAEHLTQEFLALQQWSFSNIEAVAIERVEKVVGERDVADQFLGGPADTEAILEFLKIAAAIFIESDNFAVKNGRAGTQILGEILKLRKLRGDIALGPGK